MTSFSLVDFNTNFSLFLPLPAPPPRSLPPSYSLCPYSTHRVVSTFKTSPESNQSLLPPPLPPGPSLPKASLPPPLVPSAWSPQSSQRVLLRYKSLLKALGGSHLTQSESQRPRFGIQGPLCLASDLTSPHSPRQPCVPPTLASQLFFPWNSHTPQALCTCCSCHQEHSF